MSNNGFFVIDRPETGSRIRRYREGMQLTREGLVALLCSADGTEISVNSVGRWERGEVDISFEHAALLARVFGCKIYGELVVYHLRQDCLEVESDDRLARLHIYSFLVCKASDTTFQMCMVCAVVTEVLPHTTPVGLFNCRKNYNSTAIAINAQNRFACPLRPYDT